MVLFGSVLFLICFLLTAVFRGSFNTINLNVNLWADSVNSGFFTPAAKVISVIFNTTALFILTVIVAVYLFATHHKNYSLLLLGAMAGDALLVQIFKTLVMSPRPLNEIIASGGYSFPSGHTTGSVVFFGVLTYFAWVHWGSKKVKLATGGFYVSITALVGFDRIYLNVHWFSDIIGAVFLGAFWLSFCILTFKYATSNHRVQNFSQNERKTVPPTS